jgi:hypothetical protein
MTRFESLLSSLTDIRKRSGGSQFYISMSFRPKMWVKGLSKARVCLSKTMNSTPFNGEFRQTQTIFGTNKFQ